MASQDYPATWAHLVPRGRRVYRGPQDPRVPLGYLAIWGARGPRGSLVEWAPLA